MGLGVEPAPGTPDQLAALMRDDLVRWGKIVRDSGAQRDQAFAPGRLAALDARPRGALDDRVQKLAAPHRNVARRPLVSRPSMCSEHAFVPSEASALNAAIGA